MKIPRSQKAKIPGYIILLLISALVFGSGLTVYKLATIPYYGYEGAYGYWYGLKTNNEYSQLQGKVPNPIVYREGDPRPVYADLSEAATWDWSMQNLNLDPYAFDDYWCNLIAETSGNGQFERDFFGNYRTDSIRWVNPTTYDGDPATKMTEATIYYADIMVDLNTEVDDTNWFSTEKDDYWRATDLVMWTHIHDWNNLPPSAYGEGNATGVRNDDNWSAILGVEVVSVEKIQGKNEIVDLSFNSGDMLLMYRDWGEFLGSNEYDVKNGPDLIASLQQVQPTTVPVEVRQDVLTSLHFNKFGNTGTDPWLEPYYAVKLRVHILKVGEWVVTQQVTEPWEPKIVDRPEGWYAILLDILGNPWNQLLLALGGGFIAIVAAVIILAVFAPSVLLLILTLIRRRKKKGGG